MFWVCINSNTALSRQPVRTEIFIRKMSPMKLRQGGVRKKMAPWMVNDWDWTL